MKKDYMARLERAARWRLPRQEAEDVIADYWEIVGTPPRRSESELRREVGDPEQVVKLLVSPPRAYRAWQAAFAAMAACILIPGVSPHGPFYWIWDKCFAGFADGTYVWPGGPYGYWGPVLGLLGAAGALVWFRRTGQKEGKLPRAFRVSAAVLLAWTALTLLADWAWMSSPEGFAAMWGEKPLTLFFGLLPFGPPGATTPRSVDALETAMQYGGTAMALLGVYGLVKARTGDRRWAAVYILAITAMLVSMVSLLTLIYGFDVSPAIDFAAGWQRPYLYLYAAITLLGLAGAGAALC